MRANLIFSPIILGILALVVIIIIVLILTGSAGNFTSGITGAIEGGGCGPGYFSNTQGDCESVCETGHALSADGECKLISGERCHSLTDCKANCLSGEGTFTTRSATDNTLIRRCT